MGHILTGKITIHEVRKCLWCEVWGLSKKTSVYMWQIKHMGILSCSRSSLLYPLRTDDYFFLILSADQKLIFEGNQSREPLLESSGPGKSRIWMETEVEYSVALHTAEIPRPLHTHLPDSLQLAVYSSVFSEEIK